LASAGGDLLLPIGAAAITAEAVQGMLSVRFTGSIREALGRSLVLYRQFGGSASSLVLSL